MFTIHMVGGGGAGKGQLPHPSTPACSPLRPVTSTQRAGSSTPGISSSGRLTRIITAPGGMHMSPEARLGVRAQGVRGPGPISQGLTHPLALLSPCALAPSAGQFWGPSPHGPKVGGGNQDGLGIGSPCWGTAHKGPPMHLFKTVKPQEASPWNSKRSWTTVMEMLIYYSGKTPG